MALPPAEPGQVIRYDYLWLRQAPSGHTSGKERPACIVATIDEVTDPRLVVILPITHAQPRGDTVGVEIPHAVTRHLKLDDARSWVVISEANVDHWPNAGLASIPGKRGAFTYGFLPPQFFEEIRGRFLALVSSRRTRLVRR